MSWIYKRKVKYYETDRMGVVHHSNYLRLIEDARMDWLNDNVMNYHKMEEMGVIIPAASAEGKFISFLHYDDPFSVEIKLIKFNGVKMTFSYIVRNSDTDKICYTGKSSHFLANGNSDNEYKPYLSFRKKYPEIYEKIKSLVEEE
ncbi:MAG: acyl-CoA thioesterase [Ruminococcus sp.]